MQFHFEYGVHIVSILRHSYQLVHEVGTSRNDAIWKLPLPSMRVVKSLTSILSHTINPVDTVWVEI